MLEETAPSTNSFVAMVKPREQIVATTVSTQIKNTRRCTHFDQQTVAAIPGL